MMKETFSKCIRVYWLYFYHSPLILLVDRCFIWNCKKPKCLNVRTCDQCNEGFMRVEAPLGFACARNCPLSHTQVSKTTCVRGSYKSYLSFHLQLRRSQNRYQTRENQNGRVLNRVAWVSGIWGERPKREAKTAKREAKRGESEWNKRLPFSLSSPPNPPQISISSLLTPKKGLIQ